MKRLLFAAASLSAAISVAWLSSQAAHGQASGGEGSTLPAWLYPTDTPSNGPPPAPDAVQKHQVPGSDLSLTMAQITEKFGAPDWHADGHPAMPPVVGAGQKPMIWACAYCHLPNGQGRPEDVALAGLRGPYFLRALADYKSGERTNSSPAVTAKMIDIAKAMTDDQAKQAADYYQSIKYKPWIKVVETDTAPSYRVAARLMIPIAGKTEPLGQRIVEVPADVQRTSLRDDASGFIAYVPQGSIQKGEALATGASGDTTACSACHGAGLRGSPMAPPLAGRSPTSMLRQLYDFKSGARKGAGAAQMQPVVANLTLDQMIAISAYTGSLNP